MANVNTATLTRADLTAAAWSRFEAARTAQRLRKVMSAKHAEWQTARDAYQKAADLAVSTARDFELMEQRMLLQEGAPVAVAVAS